MAFTLARSGDRFLKQQGISGIPKNFTPASYVAAWAAALTPAQTAPQVGDLVVVDATGNLSDVVRQCVVNEVPYGIVDSVNSANGTLSVVKFSKAFAIILEVPNTAGVTIGHSIQANATPGTIKISGNLRNQVKDVALAAGSGFIVAIRQAGAPGTITVEFPGAGVAGAG